MAVVITWTKSWSSSDDGTILGGADLGNIQTDVAGHSHSGLATLLSELNDVSISSVAQGNILYRGASLWNNLAVGTAGQSLTTGGASANPAWAGMTTQGDIEYHNGTTRTRLAAGTSGYFLKTQGVGANPTWGTVHQDQVSQANGVTSSPTTTSTSFVDLTDMSITLTTGANPVFIIFHGTFDNDTLTQSIHIVIDIDGTDYSDIWAEPHVAGKTFVLSTATIQTMTAASHTFKIQWRVTGGTGTAQGTNRYMQVIELG